MENLLEKLLIKGSEYYECAQHIHLRGCAEVLNEAAVIVEDLKKVTCTWEDVKKAFERYGDKPINLEKDPYLTAVHKMFMTPPPLNTATADEILEDYSRKDSTVDIGNVYYAACFYRDAYTTTTANMLEVIGAALRIVAEKRSAESLDNLTEIIKKITANQSSILNKETQCHSKSETPT